MATVVCPHCGFEQEPGIKCRKCYGLFAYHRPETAPETPAEPPAPPGLLRRVYNVACGVSMGLAALSLFMMLRTAPAPPLSRDPNAATRLETKLQESQAATEARQPHELRLTEAELNSFLGASLQMPGSSAASAGTSPAAGQSPSGAATDSGAGQSGASTAADGAAPAGTERMSATQSQPRSVADARSAVRDVQISLLSDRVQAYVVFDFHGKNLSLLLEGHLHVQDGFLRFEPLDGRLGLLPIPHLTLTHTVNDMLNTPENRERMRVPPQIQDISVVDGELVVKYR